MFATSTLSFLNQGIVAPEALRPGDFAIFGAGVGTPYPARGEVGYDLTTGSADAPAAVRVAVNQTSTDIDHYDFDLGGPLLPQGRRLADLGDLLPDDRAEVNRDRIQGATRRILGAGAIPILIGGDDSVPIPFLRAFADGGPIDILQIDAHIDWRDSIGGEALGYSSTMRRASELPFVRSITQVGMRGVGSARVQEVQAALAWGARLVTVREARALGPDGVAGLMPDGGRLVVQVDADAFDPSVCPAVNAPTPGGFRFEELADLIAAAIARKGLAGLSVVELVPAQDPYRQSANAVGRLVCNAIGQAARRA